MPPSASTIGASAISRSTSVAFSYILANLVDEHTPKFIASAIARLAEVAKGEVDAALAAEVLGKAEAAKVKAESGMLIARGALGGVRARVQSSVKRRAGGAAEAEQVEGAADDAATAHVDVEADVDAASSSSGNGGVCCGAWNPIAMIRYRLVPADQSIWWQLHSPVWWLARIALATPTYGISSVAACLWLLLTDVRDEYQLISFILNFKALAFIGAGLGSGTAGCIWYYVCAVGGAGTCPSPGPTLHWLVAILFGVQVLAVWVAFLLVPCSTAKGSRYTDKGTDDDPNALRLLADGAEPRRLFRLNMLFLWDVLSAALSIGTLIAVSAVRGTTFGTLNEQLAADLYMARILYGLLSFPFLPFALPLVPRLITNAAKTGYTTDGRTVPYRVYRQRATTDDEANGRSGRKAAQKLHETLERAKETGKVLMP